MRILADHDVWAVTLDALKDAGHDVVTASELGLAQATTMEVLARAVEDGPIPVKRDRAFGRPVFADERSGGIVYLRIQPSTENAVHGGLLNGLTKHPKTEIL